MIFAEKICLLPIWFPNNCAIETMYEQQEQNQNTRQNN
jgi:hypothetical protein